MVEFFKSYGIWIVLGLLFLLMLRSYAHGGGGCCGGEYQHDPETPEKEKGQQTDASKRSAECH